MPQSRRKSIRPQPVAPRDCGECNVCCTAMHVAALDKPAGVPCEHQGKSAGGGCGIYEHRPSVCRNWYCMWVRDHGNVFADGERPDKLGVFFTVGKRQHPESSRVAGLATQIGGTDEGEADEQVIYVHPIRPNGERGIAARVVIDRMRRYFPVHILPHRGPSGSGQGQGLTLVTNEGQPLNAAASDEAMIR